MSGGRREGTSSFSCNWSGKGLHGDCIVRQQISFLCSEAFEPADQTQVSHSNGFLPLVLLQES